MLIATEDMFARFAASGLAILFGVQAAINMSVNLQLIPAKGMTLPFISYGGSSIVSLAYGVGMMLALTRQRPLTEMESIGDANAASYACPDWKTRVFRRPHPGGPAIRASLPPDRSLARTAADMQR